jgi:hypothetical protein
MATLPAFINVKTSAGAKHFSISRPVIGLRGRLQKLLASSSDFSSSLISGQFYCGQLGRAARKSSAYDPFLPLLLSLEHDKPCAVAGADEVFYEIAFLTNVATFPTRTFAL